MSVRDDIKIKTWRILSPNCSLYRIGGKISCRAPSQNSRFNVQRLRSVHRLRAVQSSRKHKPGETLPRFENSRNVEMNLSEQFAGGLNEFLCRFQQTQRLTFVLQPVMDFFPFGIIPDDVRRPKLGGVHLRSGRNGRRTWLAVIAHQTARRNRQGS